MDFEIRFLRELLKALEGRTRCGTCQHGAGTEAHAAFEQAGWGGYRPMFTCLETGEERPYRACKEWRKRKDSDMEG